MLVFLLGAGSDTILKELEAADVGYSWVKFPSNEPVMCAGETIEILTDVLSAVPWDAIAVVIQIWLQRRSSRKVIITTTGNSNIHAEGLSAEEVKELLKIAKHIAVIETKKPDSH